MQSKFVMTLACVALSTAACGLKGPLYRPEDRQQATPATPEESDKLRRPRPAPQVQKEPRGDPAEESSAPVTPGDPDRDPGTSASLDCASADSTR